MNIRKCVVSKHNTLYYRNRRNCIELLRIYDNRQNPDHEVFVSLSKVVLLTEDELRRLIEESKRLLI